MYALINCIRGNFIGVVPYNNAGAVCSECPAGQTACVDNLCTQGSALPLEVCFVDDTPAIDDRTVTLHVEANQPVTSMLCFFNGKRRTDCKPPCVQEFV